jgi:hypothetical protein
MRTFSSYGPLDKDEHYYAPRKELTERAYTLLTGENPAKGGHYITVWAPRQTGKSWLMQQILFRLQEDPRFDVLKLNLEDQKDKTDTNQILRSIANKIRKDLGKPPVDIGNQEDFQEIFNKSMLDKPLVLILDEFDALEEKAINTLVSAFRNIYNVRMDELNKPVEQKKYRLHGAALIGVRTVLGVENVKGSPFNVQRSLHIPNLAYDEVKDLFLWYERESGQKIEPDAIDKLYYKTNGQPGLTCWFGELLTETYNKQKDKPLTAMNFEEVYAVAVQALPNNNILNIISKAKQEPYKQIVLELFKTDEKIKFKYDDTNINYLYMNGVIDQEKDRASQYYIKFPCQFVQERLFNYFSNELFRYMGRLYEPFENLDEVITETYLDIPNLAKLYRKYIKKNRDWLFKDAPRRSDMRIFEAVFHFNFYSYLDDFLRRSGGRVIPEFPTGNGKIDLIISYKDRKYGIELKSFTDKAGYKEALDKAARYGKKLGLTEIYLVFFVEYADEESIKKYEADYLEKESGVTVKPIFIETGN